jgi:hypothetical protein
MGLDEGDRLLHRFVKAPSLVQADPCHIAYPVEMRLDSIGLSFDSLTLLTAIGGMKSVLPQPLAIR